MSQIPTDRHITYQFQYRKCGKSSCSTCQRGKGHGPYWYSYFKVDGKLTSRYIGKVAPREVEERGNATHTPTTI